jgi:hypothetical protein
MDDLAEDMGCRPATDFQTFLSDPVLWCKLWFGPQAPAQYRLTGRHSWAGAREFLAGLPATSLGLLTRPPAGLRGDKKPRVPPNRTASNRYTYDATSRL